MSKAEAESICPANKAEWRAWLKENHIKKDSIWLIIHKKKSATPTITWSDAVDEALCFGWIDSTKKSIDADRYTQYFSKRKAKSTWSKINKDKIEVLIKKGLMRAAGLKTIELAKQNGSWTILDSVEALIIPDELARAFALNTYAEQFYTSKSQSLKQSILYWLISAQRAQTRQKRIDELIENGNQGQLPKCFR